MNEHTICWFTYTLVTYRCAVCIRISTQRVASAVNDAKGLKLVGIGTNCAGFANVIVLINAYMAHTCACADPLLLKNLAFSKKLTKSTVHGTAQWNKHIETATVMNGLQWCIVNSRPLTMVLLTFCEIRTKMVSN